MPSLEGRRAWRTATSRSRRRRGTLRDLLAAAAGEYEEVTEETLELAERRVHGIKCRPRLLWWNHEPWLHDHIVLGVDSALLSAVTPQRHANYPTCEGEGTEKEYARLVEYGYWEDGDADVVSPLGAVIKPGSNPVRWRAVFDGTKSTEFDRHQDSLSSAECVKLWA